MQAVRRHSVSAPAAKSRAAARRARPSCSLSPDAAAQNRPPARGTRRRPSYNIDSIADSLNGADSDPESYVPEPLAPKARRSRRCVSECSYNSSESNLVPDDDTLVQDDPHLPTWAQVRSQFDHALDLAFGGDPCTHTIPSPNTIRARQAFLKLWTRHALADRLPPPCCI